MKNRIFFGMMLASMSLAFDASAAKETVTDPNGSAETKTFTGPNGEATVSRSVSETGKSASRSISLTSNSGNQHSSSTQATAGQGFTHSSSTNATTSRGNTVSARNTVSGNAYTNSSSSGVALSQTGQVTVKNSSGDTIYQRSSEKNVATGTPGTMYPGANGNTHSTLTNPSTGNSYSKTTEGVVGLGVGGAQKSTTQQVSSGTTDKYVSVSKGTDVSGSSPTNNTITHSTYVSKGTIPSENGPGTVDAWKESTTTITNTPSGSKIEHTHSHS